ncbi:MAG: hypothetical protein Q9170_002088 [Blastenia crenularia]
MADPLSASSGIITILDLASSVVQYLKAVKDASDDRRKLILEIGSITGFLYLLKDSAEASSAPATSTTLQSLCIPQGPLAQFETALNKIASKLRPTHGSFRRTGRALLWPFQKSEIADILYRIERQKTMFGLALQNDSNGLARLMAADIGEIRENPTHINDSLKEIKSNNEDQNQEQVLAWLQPLDFGPKHHDVFNKHHPGTGQWFLHSSEFKSWLMGGSTSLWCSGIPGAGKTVLASIVIQYVRSYIAESPNPEASVLAYVYCSYDDPDQTSINLLSSILCQILHQQSEMPQRITNLFRTHRSASTRPSFEEILNELKALPKDDQRLFLVIDALDECSDKNGTRTALLEALSSMDQNIRILVTSRTTADLIHHLPKAVHIEINAKDDDIILYVQNRLTSERRMRRIIGGDVELCQTIISTIRKSTKGMFLLARLHLDSLAKKHNRQGIRLALEKLPSELYETYNEAIQRIMNQDKEDSKLARKILTWVLYTARKLTVQELQHALAVQPNTPNIEQDALIEPEILVSVCSGIIAVEADSNLVGFIHYTAQEYLSQHWVEQLVSAHAVIAKTCITYLRYREFSNGQCGDSSKLAARLDRYPFLWYAARWWGLHMSNITDKAILKEALEFLIDDDRIKSVAELMYRFDDGRREFIPNGVNGLHIAATFGLWQLATFILERTDLDVNSQDSYGQTPLAVAAAFGHERMVAHLLRDSAIDLEAGNSSACGTALHAAARGGHLWSSQLRCIVLLIESGASLTATTNRGLSPLHVAAENGDIELVR